MSIELNTCLYKIKGVRRDGCVQGEQVEKPIGDILQCSPSNESPSYWQAVSVALYV